jgi:putative DNA primase/helicase
MRALPPMPPPPDAPADATPARSPRLPGADGGSVGDVGDLEVRRASHITPGTVRWLWRYRLAYGKLNILGGAPGLGKSYLTTTIAAAVSTGRPLPGDPRAGTKPGSTLILSYEDDPEDTLRPRLDLAGADLDRVHVVEGVREAGRRRAFGPDDVSLLGRYAEQLGDVALVVVDPVSAFVGAGIDEHRGNEIRSALEDLRVLAQHHGFAVILVMHTRKAGADTALNRLAGSQAYGALVRSALMVAPIADDDQGRCVLAHVKHNLAAKQAALAYTVGEQGVSWHGEIDVDEHEVAGNGEDDRRTGRDEAVAFLRDLLADGPVPAKQGKTEADEAGIASRTLDRARKTLGVVAKRSDGTWSWSLPTTPTTPRAPSEDGGVLGVLGGVEPPTATESDEQPSCETCDQPATAVDLNGNNLCRDHTPWGASA